MFVKRSDPNMDYTEIYNIVLSQGYKEELGAVINNMLQYLRLSNRLDKRYESSCCLYVALKELGYDPKIYIGEVTYPIYLYPHCWFDDSWIELDGKVIDLSIGAPLGYRHVSDPIVLDINIGTMQLHNLKYGATSPHGLDKEARDILSISISDYMFQCPDYNNGLMEVVREVLPEETFDIDSLYEKYDHEYRKYKAIKNDSMH